MDDRQIISLRGKKNPVDPKKPYAFIHEKELSASGVIEEVATIFLTNSECPFKCLMCDLWLNTTDKPVKKGEIPKQIHWALNHLPSCERIKLYNSGNFFDKKAIPPEDYAEIVNLLKGFKSVIVECHPRLIDRSCLDFAAMLDQELEVAIGLETVNPDILPLLNKRMDLVDFKESVAFLKENGIQTRAFILLKPPYLSEHKSVYWAKRSIDYAFECGVNCCCVIPTRTGNGALDRLKDRGLFSEPSIYSLEEVLEYGINLKTGRVFADIWDLERFSSCNKCVKQRKHRLNQMNLTQEILPEIDCTCNS